MFALQSFVLSARSGTGKTTLCRELAHHFLKQGENVGLIMLEEAPRRTVLGMVGIEMSKNITIDRGDVTDERSIKGSTACSATVTPSST